MTDETPVLEWQQGSRTVDLDDGPQEWPTHSYGPLGLLFIGHCWHEERDLWIARWRLVHLPTDRKITNLDGDPDHWKPVVERLVADFDWNFTDPACALKINVDRVDQILREAAGASSEPA